VDYKCMKNNDYHRETLQAPLSLRERACATDPQVMMGEGASSQESFYEETPSPIRCYCNFV